MQLGILYAATAYTLWGLFPIYFKALHGISPIEVLLHRMVWSLVFLVIVLTARRQWTWLGKVVIQPKVLGWFTLSAVLLSLNWYIYIWSVNHSHIVDASLGYFMNPLISVLLGFLLLHERIRIMQWAAIAIAATGVAWLTWQTGRLPWIGLILALTFGFYGLLRKTAALGALEGLSLETLLLFPLAFGYLAFLGMNGQNTFLQTSGLSRCLLAAAGPITAIPLLMFAAGARRIPLATLGLLQYITPSLQLLLGVWLYGEPFSGERVAGFAVIWTALALYSAEGLWQTWAKRALAPKHTK